MRIIKTEGPSDLLSLISIGLHPEESVCCNVHGAKENPAETKWLLDFVRDHDVVTVHDADKPGQDGATIVEGRPGWATYMANTASSSRMIALPYEITETNGKDLRDFFREGHTRAEFDVLIEQAVSVSAEKPVAKEGLDDPNRLARVNLEQYRRSGRNLVCYRGEWMAWKRGCYRVIDDRELRAKLAGAIKREFDRSYFAGEQEEEGPVRKVTSSLVGNVMLATESAVSLPSSIDHPAWLKESNPFPADEAIATTSGILHLPSLVSGTPSLVDPTPDFFSRNCLPYPFDADAECPLWRETLRRFWPDDQQSIDTLQEWFGYCLLPDTRQHKLLMMVGPPRSGKGTVGKILQHVIGEQNLASPTLANLAGPFGMQPLLGKLVALISDARLSGRTDAIAVVERLLSISGEDPQDISRKNQTTLSGARMPVRFMIMTNELPNVHDSSGALMTRVILLRMSRSFVGSEDRTLKVKLLRELPGILNWSIDGWQRLNERGHFIQPDSGQDLIDDLHDMASPIKAFVRDFCILGPEFMISIDDIFALWEKWCDVNGREKTGRKHIFARDLISAFPNLKKSKPRIDGSRETFYVGIGERETIFRPNVSEFGEAVQRQAF